MIVMLRRTTPNHKQQQKTTHSEERAKEAHELLAGVCTRHTMFKYVTRGNKYMPFLC